MLAVMALGDKSDSAKDVLDLHGDVAILDLSMAPRRDASPVL